MTDTAVPADAALDQWRTYDEFAAGIDTYRLPNASLAGVELWHRCPEARSRRRCRRVRA